MKFKLVLEIETNKLFKNNKSDNEMHGIRKLFLAAPLPLGVTAAGSSTCLIWQSLMQDAHPDINPTGICVSGWNRPSDLSLVKRKVAGSWKTAVAFSKGIQGVPLYHLLFTKSQSRAEPGNI